MLHFVRTFSIYACLRPKNCCYIEEIQNYEKILFFKNIVENGWWGLDQPLGLLILGRVVGAIGFRASFVGLMRN